MNALTTFVSMNRLRLMTAAVLVVLLAIAGFADAHIAVYNPVTGDCYTVPAPIHVHAGCTGE